MFALNIADQLVVVEKNYYNKEYMNMQIKTLKLRIKDKHTVFLDGLAREVNTIWNFCNETSIKAVQTYSSKAKWLSGYDLQKLIAGIGKEGFDLPSQAAQQICEEYATRRKQFKKVRLNWRVSNQKSPKRSLGWIPFKKGAVVYKAGQIRFGGKFLNLWDSYGLDKYELRAGSFSQDAHGRWYLNVAVKVEVKPSTAKSAVGIDLGLRECAATSDGQVIIGRFYRKLEQKLSIAQRAKKKQRVRAIHAKIANQRKDMLHKFSTKVVEENAAVFVGNVSSAKLIKTKMAKSTLDAGWSMLKTMLEYKSHQAGVVFREVNEAYSTQTCSSCGSISHSSPKGRADLGISEWTCDDCGTVHDRNQNAAINIREAGHRLLAVGIPAL